MVVIILYNDTSYIINITLAYSNRRRFVSIKDVNSNNSINVLTAIYFWPLSNKNAFTKRKFETTTRIPNWIR